MADSCHWLTAVLLVLNMLNRGLPYRKQLYGTANKEESLKYITNAIKIALKLI